MPFSQKTVLLRIRAIEHNCYRESPVSIMPGLDWNQEGKTRPLKVEKPRMSRLREELRSTYCREDGKQIFSSGGVELAECQRNRIKSHDLDSAALKAMCMHEINQMFILLKYDNFSFVSFLSSSSFTTSIHNNARSKLDGSFEDPTTLLFFRTSGRSQ